MGWIKINPALRFDPKAQLMPAREFKKAFLQAIEGRGGPLAEWVKPCNGRLPESQWSKLRADVYARDDYTCQYCGERGKKLECDHVTPVSRGGTHDLSNLKTACFKCNRSKRDKTLEEWSAANDRRAS